MLPERNGPDLDDVPQQVRDQLTVHLVSDVAQVLQVALEPAGAADRERSDPAPVAA